MNDREKWRERVRNIHASSTTWWWWWWWWWSIFCFKIFGLYCVVLKRLSSYLPNSSARAGYDTRSTFKRGLTGFTSEFSFSLTSCLTKAEEPSLPSYLPIAGGRIIGFIPFPRVLVLCEMQSVSSRIWTRVTVFISGDDNHYTARTSKEEVQFFS